MRLPAKTIEHVAFPCISYGQRAERPRGADPDRRSAQGGFGYDPVITGDGTEETVVTKVKQVSGFRYPALVKTKTGAKLGTLKRETRGAPEAF